MSGSCFGYLRAFGRPLGMMMFWLDQTLEVCPFLIHVNGFRTIYPRRNEALSKLSRLLSSDTLESFLCVLLLISYIHMNPLRRATR